MRVTLRRLRSILATFAPLFDADAVAPLRDELKWVAGELGGARDAEVVHKRLSSLVASPEERALAGRIGKELAAAEAAGVERSIAALDSDRYSELLRNLNVFVADPPWTPDEHGYVDDLPRRRVRRDWKRLRSRVESAHAAPKGAERQAAFHEVRKAAKRLRYSSETLVPEYGEDASRLARGARQVQTDLGELQDSAVAQGVLRELATAAGTPTDEVFVLGGLDAQERLLSAQAEAHWARAWAKLARKRNRRWLT